MISGGVDEVQMIHWLDYCRIIGIPPSILSHKIQLMLDHKPSIENQRRLNRPMHEVVKKEIIKWFNVGVVYPIVDTNCVYPI